MKRLIVNLFFFITTTVFSQQYYFGDFQTRYALDKAHLFSKNKHSISKPYLIEKDNFPTVQSGFWSYSSSMDSSSLKILPLIGFQGKYDLIPNNSSNSSLIGAQVNTLIGEKIFSQLRIGYQSGSLSHYELNSNYKRPFAPGFGYLNDSLKSTYSKLLFEGIFSYRFNKYFVLSSGIDRNFFGDGYRSLWLSDYAPAYPFMKLESTFWKAKYINLWSLHDDLYTQRFSRRKFSSSHMLSVNVTDWLNLSLFESVVWQAKDTLSARGFDINYINPFIFFRPVEYSIGSADNSFLGGGVKISFLDHFVIYGNFILDEFLLGEFLSSSGWWGNKYGFQFGIKAFDLMNIKGLYSLLECNLVRPYTYAHMSSMQNYGHQNHSLAHPLEANFKEALILVGYQKGNFDFLIQYHLQQFGKDINGENYGSNIFNSYNDRFGNNVDDGHFIGQGEKTNQQILNTRISCMLFPLTNTKLFTQFNYRLNKTSNNLNQNILLNFGISSNLWQSYLDY